MPPIASPDDDDDDDDPEHDPQKDDTIDLPSPDGTPTLPDCSGSCFLPVRLLGRGAMGTVVLCIHGPSKTPYAVKAMSKEAMVTRGSLLGAQMEREVMCSLAAADDKSAHPFLPRLYSHFETANYSFLVTEYCPGGDLHSLRLRQAEKRFSEAAIRFYAAEIILALEHLHEHLGIVYRDLKPDNVLISEGGHVVLTDFDLCLRLSPQDQANARADALRHEGLDDWRPPEPPRGGRWACFAPRGHATWAGARAAAGARRPSGSTRGGHSRKVYVVGTEEYVAPEVLRGRPYGCHVDWWALGVVVYEMFYGRAPFRGPTRRATFGNILGREPALCGPAASPLQDLLRGLLAKDPARRLGFEGGAAQVKAHPFFSGLQWGQLSHVARPPVVPPPAQPPVGPTGGTGLEAFLDAAEAARRPARSSDGELQEDLQSSDSDDSSD